MGWRVRQRTTDASASSGDFVFGQALLCQNLTKSGFIEITGQALKGRNLGNRRIDQPLTNQKPIVTGKAAQRFAAHILVNGLVQRTAFDHRRHV